MDLANNQLLRTAFEMEDLLYLFHETWITRFLREHEGILGIIRDAWNLF